jgi:hypothetical protein
LNTLRLPQKALLTSRFKGTLMCFVEEKTRLVYQTALDSYSQATDF